MAFDTAEYFVLEPPLKIENVTAMLRGPTDDAMRGYRRLRHHASSSRQSASASETGTAFPISFVTSAFVPENW
jgi:hypothetical protein